MHAQKVRDTYLYSGFGTPLASTGLTENSLLFIGELGYYFDGDTEDYLLYLRYYQSRIARFLSKDLVPTNHRPYRYANGDPIRFVDPYGLQPNQIIPGITTCRRPLEGIGGRV